jgi:hypothetical protein
MIGQHTISTIMAALMLVASVNCVCHAAPAAATSKAPHACCSNDSKEHQKQPADSERHDGKCIHCQRSLINDTVSIKQAGHVLDPSHYMPALVLATWHVQAIAHPQSISAFDDLPPPVSPATLLDLHCALTT